MYVCMCVKCVSDVEYLSIVGGRNNEFIQRRGPLSALFFNKDPLKLTIRWNRDREYILGSSFIKHLYLVSWDHWIS